MAEHDQVLSKFSTNKYELLRFLVIDNINHFRKLHGKNSSRLVEMFSQFLASLNAVELEVKDLANVVHIYDLDANTPGNGYRSIIAVVETFMQLSIELCQKLVHKRRDFVFFKKRFVRQVSEYNRVLEGLLAVVRISQTLRLKNEPGSLFSFYDNAFLQRILMDMENVDRTCFFENLIAFQFDESVAKSLRFVCLSMASISHIYFSSGSRISRIFAAFLSLCRYSHSPKKLSKRFVKVCRNASSDFCSTFWNLQGVGFLKKFIKEEKDPLAINRLLSIQPEPLQLCREDGTLVDIPIPTSHIPVAPVNCRLLSANVREGQLEDGDGMQHSPDNVKAASPYLIIYIYGSGYICGPSTLTKVYINDWAIRLDVPILCIYHSLAPEAPYPRPLEDCFYAYAWAIKNAQRLGSTGEHICLTGSSAGGDLVTWMTMMAIQHGIRKPDGILAVCSTIVTHYFLPSPSSLLSLMDPLIPIEISLCCWIAYAGNSKQPEQMFVNRSIDEGKKIHVLANEVNMNARNDPLKSSWFFSDEVLAQFPPTTFVSTHLDPVLDYMVMFLKRARKFGVNVHLDILENLPHGFLNFAFGSQPANEGSILCIQRIRQLLNMPHFQEIL